MEQPVTALPETHQRTGRARSRILRAAGCVAAILVVAAIRWWMRLEPANSDDLALFEYASDAVAGQHWLFTSSPRPALGPDRLCLSCQDGGMSHQSLRIGMLPVAMPILWLFGRSAASYYLVPSLFALVGVAGVWLLARRNIGIGAAWAIAALHAIMPYELMHASRFFADLPAAVCLLLAIVVLGGVNERSSPVLRGIGVAALLFWAYLLRANSPFLLAPGLGLLFLRKPVYRPLLLTAAAAFMAGWLGEQLLYVSKGFEFGYRTLIVSRALETYTPYLPLYSPLEFLGREVSFFWNDLRGWPHGALACAFVFFGLASQVWITISGRNETLRLVATMGITTWVVFVFGFVEWNGDGIRAAAPPSYRYLQPFFYASLLCIPFAGARALDWLRTSAPRLQPFIPAVVAGGVAVVAALWFTSDLRFPKRLDRSDQDVRPTLEAIDRASGGEAIELWSTCLQGRVVSLFTAPPVRPRCVPLEELVPVVANRSAAAVLRDTTRELAAHRYHPPDRRETALAASTALDRALWSGYSPFHIARRIVLFAPTDEPRPAFPLTLANAEVLPPEAAVQHDDTGLTVRPTATTYVLSTAVDPGARGIALCAGCRYTVRVDVDLPDSLRGDVVVRQLAGRQYRGETRQMLRAGENYLTWQGLPGADRYRVGFRLRAPAATDDARAVLRHIEVKSFGEQDRG